MFDELDITKQIIYNSIMSSHGFLFDNSDCFIDLCVDCINEGKMDKYTIQRLLNTLEMYSLENQLKLKKAIFANKLSQGGN